MTKYAEIAASEEMFLALESAAKSGLVTTDDPTDSLRFWRDDSGVLYATSRTIVEPCATPVEIEYESGAGYRAI